VKLYKANESTDSLTDHLSVSCEIDTEYKSGTQYNKANYKYQIKMRHLDT